MFSRTGWPVVVLAALVLGGCASAVMPKYGVQDDAAAASIRRVNTLAELRSSQRYGEALRQLEGDSRKFAKSAYAYPRILNEMAELYSLQILDLESAIAIDEQLQGLNIAAQDDSDFRPRHQTASQYTIADANYVAAFVTIDGVAIKKRAAERLQANRQLVAGKRIGNSKTYTADRLNQHLRQVREDIDSTPPNSAARRRILSRLIRGEYELQRVRPDTRLEAWQDIERGQLTPAAVDLSEIDFLSLADYFVRVFKQTSNVAYAEYALQTVYRPYTNLRAAHYRWQYNKLINDYIGMLIEANHQAGRHDDMLYYASLNKSRMLLEERLAFAQGGASAKVADLAVDDGIPRTAAGLPEKSWFQRKLAATDGYLDFYIAGRYDTQKKAVASKAVARAERSTMPLTTRDFGVESTDAQEDVYVDDALYVMRVEGGRVASVKKATGQKLGSLKAELDAAYRQISNKDLRNAPVSRQLQELAGTGRQQLMVSPDKWMARHPLDYHLGSRVTRSVNFFTAADQGKLRDLRASGFYNPTLDLKGAEQEAEAMRAVLPALQAFSREQATLAALERAADATIVHLSMHGQFNADEPAASRLAFAGAAREKVLTDPNSLYARDMYKYAALKDRDLVFAAACQAGLSAADQSNQSELMGILRPLTANRNRNIILSLWNVSDLATRDFVSSFYKHLAANRDVAKSFHAAQGELRQKYPDPYYWAAFYLAQAR